MTSCVTFVIMQCCHLVNNLCYSGLAELLTHFHKCIQYKLLYKPHHLQTLHTSSQTRGHDNAFQLQVV